MTDNFAMDHPLTDLPPTELEPEIMDTETVPTQPCHPRVELSSTGAIGDFQGQPALTDLSEADEQQLAGGFGGLMRFDFMFIQNTAINTFAANETSISGSAGGTSLSGSSRSMTGYSLQQNTIFAGSLWFGGGGGRGGFGRGGNPMSIVFGMMRRFGFGG